MGYTLKDTVGAKLVNCVEIAGSIALELDNNLSLVVRPLPNSQKGLVIYPQPDLFIGQKIVNVEFEMWVKEGFYDWSENVNTNEVHHRRLVLEAEHHALHIESTSFDVPIILRSACCYSVY